MREQNYPTNSKGESVAKPRAHGKLSQGYGFRDAPGSSGGDLTVQTGVGFLICAAHRDKVTGAVHGHTYEAVCWFDAGDEAEALQAECARLCADLDHGLLPVELAWAEDLIREIKRRTNAVDVEIRRPLERLYARSR